MITWIFQSVARLKRVSVSALLLGLTLLILLTAGRLSSVSRQQPEMNNTWSSEQPEPVSSGLLPPSPATEPAPTATDYGPSTPIALEAVQAFLQGDRARFAELAQAEAVESVNDAPTPGGQITEPGRILLGGPTQQSVLVPTTDGELTLTMIVVNGAWKVAGMEYAK